MFSNNRTSVYAIDTPTPPAPIVVPCGYCYRSRMARQGTRVNLTLPDDVIAALDRMGAATGAGRATIIREWLIEGLPQFNALADAVEMASRKNIDAFKVMADMLNETARDADQLVLDIRKERRAAMRKRPK